LEMNSVFQIRHALCFVVNAMATAIGTVLAKKYVRAIPTSGSAVAVTSIVGDPPSRSYTWPAASTVMTRIAILKSVRYGGLGDSAFRVVWLQPVTAATIMVACG